MALRGIYRCEQRDVTSLPYLAYLPSAESLPCTFPPPSSTSTQACSVVCLMFLAAHHGRRGGGSFLPPESPSTFPPSPRPARLA